MSKNNQTASQQLFQPQFAVAAIGASAGGLEAIKLFLSALPPQSGIAYIFVQHLSPTHVSILPELLEKISPIPVITITDGINIEPDHFYVNPENAVVKVVNNTLKLELPDKKQKKANSIDTLFTSLGLAYESHAIGIVLSGAMSDGTMGLQTIKSYGGITFAQDEASAAFEGMPKSAHDSGVVDYCRLPRSPSTLWPLTTLSGHLQIRKVKTLIFLNKY